MGQDTSSQVEPQLASLVAGAPWRTTAVIAASVAAWGILAWIALDMDHPLVRLTMPGLAAPAGMAEMPGMAGMPGMADMPGMAGMEGMASAPEAGGWSGLNLLAVYLMWSIMMAAMMLPSGLPMVLTFVHLSTVSGERARALAFVGAYLLVWSGFSAFATAAQWAFQAMGWVDPMVVSRSARLTGLLLVIAGIYQFSPLKRYCLTYCRTPLGFLVTNWQPGAGGAFRMGAWHGLTCMGCCWALMALLFVGGVMNLAWVAALAIIVAVEKMAPGGDRLARLLGFALIAAGLVKLVWIAAAG